MTFCALFRPTSAACRRVGPAVLLAALTLFGAPAWAATGQLSGRVSDGAGAPIPGAVVQLFSGSTLVAQATSDAEGVYGVEVEDGAYDIIVEPPMNSGLTLSRYTGFAISGPTNLNVVLVRRSVTFSGVFRTTEGVPIDDAAISLSGTTNAGTRTSSTGAFSLTVAPGTYDVGLNRCCPTPSDAASQFDGLIQGLNLTTDLTQELVLPVSRARVTVVAPDGTPVAGTDVVPQSYVAGATLWAGGPAATLYVGPGRPSTTGSDGSATIALIPGNPVTLKATPPSASGFSGTTASFDARSDVDVTIRLPRPTTFSGVLRTSKGVPMQDVDLLLYGGPSHTWARTSATGAFSISVSAGIHTLLLRNSQSNSPDYPLGLEGEFAGVDVTADRIQDLEVPVTQARVTVVAPDGVPVPGTNVVPLGYGRANTTLWPGGPAGNLQTQSAAPTMTGPNGSATLALIPANPVTLRATPPEASGFPGTTATVDVTVDSEHTIRLARPATFSGVLRTTRGVPIPNASIALKGPSTASTTTSTTGGFSVAVAPGRYVIEIDRCCSATPDYPALIMIRLDGFDLTTDLTRDLEVPVSQARVTVRGPDGRPVEGVRIAPENYFRTGTSLWPGGPEGMLIVQSAGLTLTDVDGLATVGLIAHNPVTLHLLPQEALHLSNAVVSNLDARTDTTTVVVLKIDEASVRSLAVTPVDPHTLEGSAQQLTATATYTDGTTKDVTSSVMWSSSATGVATIDANGLARGIAAGAATIRATVGSVAAETTLTVDPVVKEADLSVAVAHTGGPIRWGEAVTYTLTARNGGPGEATGTRVSLALSGPGTVASASGPAGACTVTASSATCPLGRLGREAASVTVTVAADGPGTLTARAHVAANEADPRTADNDATDVTTVGSHRTTLTFTGASGPLPVGVAATLSGTLTDGGSPVAARSLTFTLGSGAGSQACSATTDATGKAACTLPRVNQPLGPGTVNATFSGDTFYEASSDSRPTLVFAFAPETSPGAFVVGDQTATGTVTFWGSQWSKENSLSGGAAPTSFKGFARNPATPSCGATWSTDPGDSAPPPQGPLPDYMGVIVTSSTSQSGPQVSGSTTYIVVVKTNPGYDARSGAPGTGTVVARFC